MSSIINDTNLPKCFINKIVSPTNDDGITVVRSGIQSMADITKWIKEFGQNTNTHWIVSKSVSEGQRIVCSKHYVCQYNSSRKAKEKNRISPKEALCQAKINFQVKLNTSYTRASDVHIREGLCGVIIIKSKHSHPIEPEDTLRFAMFHSPLKDTFFEYFDSGLDVSQALKYHQDKSDVSMENNNKIESNVICNKANPTERTVKHWYDQWKKLENLKRRTEIAVNKATTSGALQPPSLLPSPLLSPSLHNHRGYYRSPSPYNNQTEFMDQGNLTTEDNKDPSKIKDFRRVSYEGVNMKANLSPPSMVDRYDEVSIMSPTLTVRNEESMAFGEYVGLSLSRMDDCVRSMVIHKISRVIYESDMDKLNKESGDSKVEEVISSVGELTVTSSEVQI